MALVGSNPTLSALLRSRLLNASDFFLTELKCTTYKFKTLLATYITYTYSCYFSLSEFNIFHDGNIVIEESDDQERKYHGQTQGKIEICDDEVGENEDKYCDDIRDAGIY